MDERDELHCRLEFMRLHCIHAQLTRQLLLLYIYYVGIVADCGMYTK